MSTLQLYAFFHLNLAYSSIEEEQHKEVIDRCYWPLLRLARDHSLPIGIEASGYTLEAAAAVDPEWVAELRRLTSEGTCEFIGSGYAQLIGPLVPAEVNAANLRLGHQVYEHLLGLRPELALVNEQAYSAGLVEHYLDAGYKAIVMEWDNCARFHSEWDPQWRYLPQYACDQHDREIPLIWNKSIAFQKFQRYVHAEMDLDEYLDYLGKHRAASPRAFPLYGNDVEIFNFRPGRYETEAALQEQEWERMAHLIEALRDDARFRFIPPVQVLELLGEAEAGHRLHLESPEQPIPVKKQGKYNITRWAVTGRDDVNVNTACWRICEALKASQDAGNEEWRELCYLWSSDFRTHITDKRWSAYLERLRSFESRVCRPREKQAEAVPHQRAQSGSPATRVTPGEHNARLEGRYLTVETDAIKVRLNCRRGLAIDALWFKGASKQPLVGTLSHGYYDDISLGADFYTGHVVLEAVGQPKVTDLNLTHPTVTSYEADKCTSVMGIVPTPLGDIGKQILVSHSESRIEIIYRFNWKSVPIGSLRLGHITLNPEAFDRDSLFYAVHNGGYRAESFPLKGRYVAQGAPVSFLVSASSGLGITAGVVALGDARQTLCIEVDKTSAGLIGLVSYQETGDRYFCRLALSAAEVDETRRQGQGGRCHPLPREIRLAMVSTLL